MPVLGRKRGRAWEDTVRWALIRMREERWLHCPFGNVDNGNVQGRGKWFRVNRPKQNNKQQIWTITKTGKEYLTTATVDLYAEDIAQEQITNLIEGAVRRITVNAYERDSVARRQCIGHYGYKCTVCNFDFGKVYGLIGYGYIHVHHLKPLSKIKQEYRVDPIEDLRPVCPNCHSMLHKRTPPFSIDELQEILQRHK